MSYSTPDPYNQPERFGLEILKSTDDGASYEFDITVLWWHRETGQFYVANDSGCSCPSPFESYESLDDLYPVDTVAALSSWLVDIGTEHDSRLAIISAALDAGLR